MSSNGGNVCCGAYESCMQEKGVGMIEITNGGDITCGGFHSCEGTTLDIKQSVTSNLYCLGFASCFSSIIEGNGNEIVYCGLNSGCLAATINNVENLYVSGFEAAIAATINGVSNIYVTGGSGISGTMVNSDGVGRMSVYVGESFGSDNAHINCAEEDFCTIYCQTRLSCQGIRFNVMCDNYQVFCANNGNTTSWDCLTVTDGCPGMFFCFLYSFTWW